MPPVSPPPPSSPSPTACEECQEQGQGYCVRSDRCDVVSLDPCAISDGGYGASEYVAPSQQAYNNLIGYQPDVISYDCLDAFKPVAPPPSPIEPPSPPTPPSPPPCPRPPPPSPPPPPFPPLSCSDSCPYPMFIGDGVCDDGGPGAEYAYCAWGTDCTDCAQRIAPSPPPQSPPTMPPLLPPYASPSNPRSPDQPPPPPASEVAPFEIVLEGAAGGLTAACAWSNADHGGGCTYGYALASTPVLLSSSPTAGNQGDTLTVRGHGLSTEPSENAIYVGGRSCEVLTATRDTSYIPPACPVTSCTDACPAIDAPATAEPVDAINTDIQSTKALFSNLLGNTRRIANPAF